MEATTPTYIYYIFIGLFVLGVIRFFFSFRKFWGGTFNLNKGLWNQLRNNPEEMSHRIADEAKNKEEIIEILKNIKKTLKIAKMSDTVSDMTILNLNDQQKTYRITMTPTESPQILSIKHLA